MDFWNLVGLILTAIGTILSFVGTGLSFWQARKAKKYKEEIQADRLKMILIELLPSAKIAREECKKIITPVGKPMRGVDPQKVMNTIQDFVDKIREHSHRFNLKEYNLILNSLNDNITAYKQLDDVNERFNVGDKIYKGLNEMISMIAQKIDRAI